MGLTNDSTAGEQESITTVAFLFIMATSANTMNMLVLRKGRCKKAGMAPVLHGNEPLTNLDGYSGRGPRVFKQCQLGSRICVSEEIGTKETFSVVDPLCGQLQSLRERTY